MYSTEGDCLNITNDCSGHGLCVQSGDTWGCRCSGFLVNFNCSENYYQVYQGKDAFYYVIGLMGFVPLLFISILEIIKHLQNEANTKTPAFATKLMIPIISLFRVWNFSLYAYQSTFQFVVVQLIVFDAVVFNLALCIGVATYLLVMYSWIQIVIAMKNLSMEKNNQFQFVQKVIIAEIIIYSPVAVILGLCVSFISYYFIVPVLYLVWECLFVLPNVIWSLVQITILFQLLSAMPKEERAVVVLKKKNIQFLLCSIVALITCLIIFSGVSILGNQATILAAWVYLIYNFAFRIAEILVCYSFFIIVEAFTFSKWCSHFQKNIITGGTTGTEGTGNTEQ